MAKLYWCFYFSIVDQQCEGHEDSRNVVESYMCKFLYNDNDDGDGIVVGMWELFLKVFC